MPTFFESFVGASIIEEKKMNIDYKSIKDFSVLLPKQKL